MIINTGDRPTEQNRHLALAIMRGARGNCPACGSGKIFARQLATTEACGVCGEELFHHRADDLPAYLNIFIVGHVVVGSMMFLMTWELFDMWTFTALTVFVALAAGIGLMRPIKGAVVGAQWALRMHGFGEHDD